LNSIVIYPSITFKYIGEFELVVIVKQKDMTQV